MLVVFSFSFSFLFFFFFSFSFFFFFVPFSCLWLQQHTGVRGCWQRLPCDRNGHPRGDLGPSVAAPAQSHRARLARHPVSRSVVSRLLFLEKKNEIK